MKKTFIYSLILLMGALNLGCNPETVQPVSQDLRKEISRKWYCELNDGQDTYNFESEITIDPANENKIFISNFNNLGAKATATVYTDRQIVLHSQTLPGTSTSVKGSATINADFTNINWTYEVTDTEGVYTATVSYTLSHISK